MSLYHFNFGTVIFIETGFFHVLRDFIPFSHLHAMMPVQTGSPLGLKGSFMLRFATLRTKQNFFKKGHEVLNSTWFSWSSAYRYVSEMLYFFHHYVVFVIKEKNKSRFHTIYSMHQALCQYKNKFELLWCHVCTRLKCHGHFRNLSSLSCFLFEISMKIALELYQAQPKSNRINCKPTTNSRIMWTPSKLL